MRQGLLTDGRVSSADLTRLQACSLPFHTSRHDVRFRFGDREMPTPQRLPITASPLHEVTDVNCGASCHSSPAMQHAWAKSEMRAKASPAFNPVQNGPGGGWTKSRPELRLDGDVAIPVLCG